MLKLAERSTSKSKRIDPQMRESIEERTKIGLKEEGDCIDSDFKYGHENLAIPCFEPVVF